MYAHIQKRCDAGFFFLAFLAVLRDWRLHFLGQCELSQVGEARGRWIAAQMQQKEIYLLKLPAIRHGRHHLCQLLLLALQYPVHMFHWNLRGGKKYKHNTGMTLQHHRENKNNKGNAGGHQVPAMFYSRVPWSCPWWALLVMWYCRIQLPPAHLQQ